MVGVVPQSPSTEAEITATLRDLLATTKQPRIVASGNGAIPWELVRLIDATLPTYRLNILNAFPGLPWREGVVHETSFVGAGMRKSPGLAYVPARLSLVPRLFRRALFPDVVLLHTSAPVNGKVSMGIEVNVLPGAVEACKHRGGLVIAQVNPRMPYTFGDGEIAVEDLDAMIHVDSPVAMPARTDAPVDEVAQQIGEYCANRISSGATLQMGIKWTVQVVLNTDLLILRSLFHPLKSDDPEDPLVKKINIMRGENKLAALISSSIYLTPPIPILTGVTGVKVMRKLNRSNGFHQDGVSRRNNGHGLGRPGPRRP